LKKQILEILQQYGEMSVAQMMSEFDVSRQYLHRQLHALLESGQIEKLGSAPRTFYRIKVEKKSVAPIGIHQDKLDFLNHYFIFITEVGERLQGLNAMTVWCERHKLPVAKTIDEFITTRKKYLEYENKYGLISGLQKIQSTKGFDFIGVDELYYSDFYAIERFGKTKLGVLLHIAKQTQNINLIREIVIHVKSSIEKLIQVDGITAVGFIPPSIKREIQFMQVFKDSLNLPLPHIDLVKAKGEIIIPQKSISKLEERIENARTTIMINDKRHFQHVLLIDDAVGSGASINETALKLKSRKLAKKVTGYAITGSFKGFDVLQEV
jgi:hypothetical protein